MIKALTGKKENKDSLSTFQTLIVSTATRVGTVSYTHLIPEDMSYEEGAMIEPLAVAVHGVKQMGDVAGLNIAVLGAGPIGNLVAQTAKGMGAAKVMITDISDLRLAKAKECGIDVCVNTKNKDFGEAMIEAFGPDKADVIYDCAGNNITMGQAIKSVSYTHLQEMDQVMGYEAGADDYITKPFSLSVLLLKIEAHFRRRPVSYTHLDVYKRQP